MDNVFAAASQVWLSNGGCSLDDIHKLVEQAPGRSQYPHCAAIESRIPIYDSHDVTGKPDSPSAIPEIMGEWNAILAGGPGAVVFKRAYPDRGVIDEVTTILQNIIAAGTEAKKGKGDHFGKPGSNARSRNAHEKPCLNDVEEQTFTIWKNSMTLGETAAKVALALANKKPVDGQTILTTPKDNKLDAVLLPVGLIDRDSLERPVKVGWTKKDLICAGVTANPPPLCK